MASTLEKQLRCNGLGSIYAHVFENPLVGVARQLFWSITLPCAPLEMGGEQWDCSFTTEWLVLGVRNWHDLDAVTLESVLAPEHVEASIYIAEHHAADLRALSIRRSENPTQFSVEIRGTVDLAGLDELDGEGIPFRIEGLAEFSGIVVVPDNLAPEPNTPEKALAEVKRFLGLESLGEPVWQRFRYLIPPL